MNFDLSFWRLQTNKQQATDGKTSYINKTRTCIGLFYLLC